MTISLLKYNLTVDPFLVSELQQFKLLIKTGEVHLYEGQSSSRTYIGQGKVSIYAPNTESSSCYLTTLESVGVYLSQKPTIAPGVRVERSGKQGWRGKVLEVSGEYALVDWGGSSEWMHRYDIYPLDESGRPIRAGARASIFEAARRGRRVLAAQPAKPAPPQNSSSHTQMELF